jgi:hypothetical protein
MLQMKTSSIILCLLLTAGAASAQKPVFKYPFTADAGAKPDILTMPHYKNGRTAFMVKDKKKMEFLLLNSNWSVASKFATAEAPEKTIYGTPAVPIGFIFSANNLYNFIYDEAGRNSKTTANNRDAILIDKINFDGGSSELSLKHGLPEGEKLVNAFTHNNTLYLLSVPQSRDAITVCYIDSVLNKTVRTYPVSYSEINSNFGYLDDWLKTAKVVQPGESDVDAYCATTKIFPQAGKIFIVSDFKDNPTSFITIDLYNNKFTNQKMAYADLGCSSDGSRGFGSTVYGNYLFVTAACKSKLELAIMELATGKVVKKFESAKDDSGPAFANTLPGVVSFSKGKNSSEKGLDQTGSLTREMMAGTAGVKVIQNEAGQYIVTVTGFKGAAPSFFPGVSYSAETAPAAPFSFHALNYGNDIKIKTSFSAAGFKSVLAPATFEKVKLNFKPGVLDKVRDQFSMEEAMPDAVALFTVNGAWFYPWYDKEAQQFIIRGIK